MSYVAGAAQIGAVMLGAPLTIGMMRQVRARLEGRAGGGVNWARSTQTARQTTDHTAGNHGGVRGRAGDRCGDGAAHRRDRADRRDRVAAGSTADLFAVVGLLFLGTVALTLAGIDTGTSFGGMGASREITIAALVEPTILLAVFAPSIPAGSANLGALVANISTTPDRSRR